MSVRLLVAVLFVQLALGTAFVVAAVSGFPLIGGGGNDSARTSQTGAPIPRVNHFFAGRAWAEARAQVALGPRPAGSPASRRLADRLRGSLPNGRFEAVPGGLRNVVGHLPGRRPAVVLAAHYDTKDIPGFVGANDGASGAASLLELSRQLRLLRRRTGAPELRFVFFDGEESPRGSPDSEFLRDGLRGSKAYAAAHAREVRALVLLDFVGDRSLSLPREAGSDAALWTRLRAAAARVGVIRAFPPRTRSAILDDHTPFAQRGIPAIDLIDFDYPYFHTTRDTLDKISAASLDASGEAVFELARVL